MPPTTTATSSNRGAPLGEITIKLYTREATCLALVFDGQSRIASAEAASPVTAWGAATLAAVEAIARTYPRGGS